MPLIGGRVPQNLVQVVIQSVAIVALAPAIGVSFSGGVAGLAVLVLAAACSAPRSPPCRTRWRS